MHHPSDEQSGPRRSRAVGDTASAAPGYDRYAGFGKLLPPGDVLIVDAGGGRGTPSPEAAEAARALGGAGIHCAVVPAVVPRHGPAGAPVRSSRLWPRPAAGGVLPYPSGAFAGCWMTGVADVLPEEAVRVLAPGAPLAVDGAIAVPPVPPVPPVPTGSAVSGMPGMPGMPRVSVGAADTPEGVAGGVVPDCVFCPAMRFQVNAMADLPGAAATLYGNDRMFVIPDVAPVVEGHLLIVTARHDPCSAAVDTATWNAVELAKEQIRRLFRQVYGTGALFFEHGPARPHGAGSCVDHTHWHCVPAAASLRPVIESRGLSGRRADRDTLRAWYRSGQSYLCLDEDGQVGRDGQGGGRMYAYPASDLQRQFLRWAARTTLGGGTAGDDWLWHVSYGSRASRSVFLDTVTRLLPRAGVFTPPRGPADDLAQPRPVPADSCQ